MKATISNSESGKIQVFTKNELKGRGIKNMGLKSNGETRYIFTQKAYDKNPHVEYDDEKIYIETDYSIQDEDKYITVIKPTYISKDGTIKNAEEVYNNNGDLIKYKALKNDILCE